MDRPDAPQRGRTRRMVSRRGRRDGGRSGAFARGRGRARAGRSARLRRCDRNAERRGTPARPDRRRGDHDAQRHALCLLRRRTRRRTGRDLRQAGDARPRPGARPGGTHARQGAGLCHRARLLRLPDDPPCPATGARRNPWGDPLGASRIHPVGTGDPRRRRFAQQPAALDPRAATQWPGAGDERHRLPHATPGELRVRPERGARDGRRGHAAAGPQSHRPCIGLARIHGRRARHLHCHTSSGRRRERHSAACLRREGHARLVAPQPELSDAVAARRAGAHDRPRRRIPAPPTSSAPAERRAATPKACARLSPTSMPKLPRSVWHASSANRFPRHRTRASKKVRTRWPSSKPALPPTRAVRG